MKTLLLALLALVMVAPASVAGDDEKAIRALIERTEQLNNDGDVEGWVALFAPGAVYMPPGSPEVHTVDGLREAATAGFTHWRSHLQIDPKEIVVSGDWAFARSHVHGHVEPREGEGERHEINLKQLVVYERQPDGSWKIARLIGNRNG